MDYEFAQHNAEARVRRVTLNATARHLRSIKLVQCGPVYKMTQYTDRGYMKEFVAFQVADASAALRCQDGNVDLKSLHPEAPDGLWYLHKVTVENSYRLACEEKYRNPGTIVFSRPMLPL